MDAFNIVMTCVMVPAIGLTIWAVGRLGSSGISNIKNKEDREKDERKEIRNYFLKHDDYVLDDKGYKASVEKKAEIWTSTNAEIKLGLDDIEYKESLSWKAWCVNGALARRTKNGVVSSKAEIDDAFLTSDKLSIYRVMLQTDSEIAEEKTYSWKKEDIRNISSTHTSEYGMGAENTDVEARIRNLSIELEYGTESFRIPDGIEGDKIVTKMKNWLKG